MTSPLIFLMGPTASGKTGLAIALCEHLPVEIINVDSAQVYRGMDIGTAKPTAEELAKAPHRLLDICDPAEPYSAADFCSDAEREINSIVAAGRIPLLVGGTMMYFNALLNGLADMPSADTGIRAAIEAEAQKDGWPALHEQLKGIDPDYAKQLHPNHSQRIARAIEVYRISGKTMTELRQQQNDARPLANRFNLIQMALFPQDRAQLHQTIADRFEAMLAEGFVEEVIGLRQRADLHPDLPSMRAVGYRQVWQYLEDNEPLNESSRYQIMVEKGVAATRQLAKRQLTWLKRWPDLQRFSFKKEKNNKKVEIILNFLSTKSI